MLFCLLLMSTLYVSRELFRLSVSHYQEWFEESMIYWLQTFRCECFQRMEKALEIDRDVVVVTSQSKYSHSSVDVLSCFAQVSDSQSKYSHSSVDVLSCFAQVIDSQQV